MVRVRLTLHWNNTILMNDQWNRDANAAEVWLSVSVEHGETAEERERLGILCDHSFEIMDLSWADNTTDKYCNGVTSNRNESGTADKLHFRLSLFLTFFFFSLLPFSSLSLHLTASHFAFYLLNHRFSKNWASGVNSNTAPNWSQITKKYIKIKL